MEPTGQSNHSSPFKALITSVRNEAVREAESEVERIHTKATEKARHLVKNAEHEAQQILDQAREEALQFQKASEDAVKRASRDVLIAMESAILAQLNAVLLRETREAMNGESLAGIIRTLVENWRQERPDEPLELLLSPANLRELEEVSWAGLKDEFRRGVTLRPVEGIDAGLRIGAVDGAGHYDFSSETMVAWLSRFIGPNLRAVLRESAETKKEE